MASLLAKWFGPKPGAALAPSATLGETTKRQGYGVGGVGSFFGFSGIGPARGTYATYRKMRTDPTLALARVVATAPIKAAQHSFEAEDGTPEEWAEAVQEFIDRVWKVAIAELLWSLDYGWKGLEIVWGVDAESGYTVPVRLKPLAVDFTEIITEGETGNYLGLRNTGTDLLWGKSLYFGYDVEDQDYYGRSRNENVRENAWAPWVALAFKQAQYFSKAAGVLPVVRYPVGVGQDVNGAATPNYKLAQNLAQQLAGGQAVYFPFKMDDLAEELLRNGAKISDLSSWSFEFVETNAGHGEEFLGTARYYDSLKMRGWLVPERAAIEGQNGTKAEAIAHADIGVLIAEQTYGQIVEAINKQLIDPFLVYNFGQSARGKVYAVATPLLDSERELARQILTAVLTNPTNIDVVMSSLDWDAMIDREGLPKAEQTVDATRPGVIDTTATDVPEEKQIAASLSSLYARIAGGLR